ncbi:MAG TPA: AtpZ/AtpI family protein [Pyrinomonadaceae bacterium]|nr:AtpZ/AtpI family protein [Pyrinomonadaceae bacterium]
MSRREDDEENVNRRSGLAYAAALTLFFSVLIFFGLGWFLDRWLGTSPWMVVGGIVLGACVGFYEFYRLISKLSD